MAVGAFEREVREFGDLPGHFDAGRSRAALYRFVRPTLPHVSVLAYSELSGARQIRSLGVVSPEHLAMAQ